MAAARQRLGGAVEESIGVDGVVGLDADFLEFLDRRAGEDFGDGKADRTVERLEVGASLRRLYRGVEATAGATPSSPEGVYREVHQRRFGEAP